MSLGGNDIFAVGALRALAALAVATVCVLAVIALGGGVERAAAGPACPTADATIDDSGDQLRRGIICLINEDRRQRDRHVLDSNGKLESAAAKHNQAMKRENCWAHQCPGEASLTKRVRRSGYLKGAERWRFAESFGCAATPEDMVDAWIGTDFNRENIRNVAFRDIGVGVLKQQIGRSRCDTGNEVTFTVIFARRKG